MSIKVKDLRTELAKFPDDTIVLVEGYEGGLSDIGVIKSVKVELDVNKEEYMGPHEENPKCTTSAVVLIKAQNPNAQN
jgi:hypothetical protein